MSSSIKVFMLCALVLIGGPGCEEGTTSNAATGAPLPGVLVTQVKGTCEGSGCRTPNTRTTNPDGRYVFDFYGDVNGANDVQRLGVAGGEPGIEFAFTKTGFDKLNVTHVPIPEVVSTNPERLRSVIPMVQLCPTGSPDTDGDGICDLAEARYAASPIIPGTPKESRSLTRAVLTVTFGQLSAQNSNCTFATRQSLSCRSASARLCRAQGYVSGVGPIEVSPEQARVLCLGGTDTVRITTGIAALTALQSGCSANQSTSNACLMATEQFCRARGFAAGGFGPEEQGGSEVALSCVAGVQARPVQSPFSELDAELAGCPAAGYDNLVCRAAVSRVCERLGYLSGFGPVGQTSTHLALSCVERPPGALGGDPRFAAANLLTTNLNAAPSRVMVVRDSCNGLRLSPVPGRPDLFFGRDFFECKSVARLTVEQRQGGEIRKVRDLLVPPVVIAAGSSGEDHVIETAYDPSSVVFRGETWLAFECIGHRKAGGGGAFGRTAATCIGPVDTSAADPSAWRLDLSRTTVVIQGENFLGASQRMVSASVPKLFTHQDRAYLYWDSARFNAAGNDFEQLVTRGVELQRESGGRRRLLAKQQRAEIASNHPDTTVVWDVVPGNPLSDSAADTFDARSDGRYIYATAALGGSGCVGPLGTSEGCYRTAISRSLMPLAFRAFNGPQINDSGPDAFAHEYSTFVRSPSGGLSILTRLLTSSDPGPFVQEFDVAPPSTTSTLGPICDPVLQPSPNWGVRNGACLPSCGGAGGTAALATSCSSAGLQSAGSAYDTEYCCRTP
jgi:hypothetical protein